MKKNQMNFYAAYNHKNSIHEQWLLSIYRQSKESIN